MHLHQHETDGEEEEEEDGAFRGVLFSGKTACDQ